MAVNDVLWVGGQARLAKSSGTTATVAWVGGQPLVIHEYVAVDGSDVFIGGLHDIENGIGPVTAAGMGGVLQCG